MPLKSQLLPKCQYSMVHESFKPFKKAYICDPYAD